MYLCIDIGGTKTIVALLDSRGKLLHSVKFATLPDYREFYSTLISQIRINFVTSAVKIISVAIPGPVKKDRVLWLGNLPWKDIDIAAQLKTDFDLPVVVENDANLAALAEARLCRGRSLYLTFSTGIGGGVIEDKKIVARYSNFEPGHTEYIYKQQRAEWEDIASGKAIRDYYAKNAEEITDPAAWQDIASRINLGLIPLITSLKPQRIIFGGPIGLALNSYKKPLRAQLKSALSTKTTLPRFQTAKYGHFSVIYGCYFYAKARLAHK